MEWNMLNGPQIWVLSEAIFHAFPDPDQFDAFLFTRLNKGPMRNQVAPGGYAAGSCRPMASSLQPRYPQGPASQL